MAHSLKSWVFFLFYLNFQNRSSSHASSFVTCERRGFKWFKSNDHTLCVGYVTVLVCLYVRPPARLVPTLAK